MALEPMHLEEIMGHLSNIEGWDEFNQDFLKKAFVFPDFKEALSFANKIGVVAEAQNHHPTLILSYGRVVVKLSTHDAEGITLKDFELAKLIDELFDDLKK